MYRADSRKIMRKLLGKVSAADTPDTVGVGPPTRPSTSAATTSGIVKPSRLTPTSAPDASYAAGPPILCLDATPDKHTAVIAGRHVLKTVRLDPDVLVFRDGIDVRAVITSQPAPGAAAAMGPNGVGLGGGVVGPAAVGASGSGLGSTVADQLSIRDVKWHGDTTVFTACANGKIFSYNIAHMMAGLELDVGQAREDTRQVNTLDINPHRDSYLLSGSQDGYVRCIDIRTPHRRAGGVLSYQAVQSFKCNLEGVRQVKWSPKMGMQFACCTEAGTIFKWDLRKATSSLLRIHGHDKACTGIAWHPDGEHLMSAGLDTKCHIWDLSESADKRQKAKHTLKTPAPVSAIVWRPGLWSSAHQAVRSAQVAVTYEESSAARYGFMGVHIWDLARPTMPYKVIDRVDRSPSGILWLDDDRLWTAGSDGMLHQFDVSRAPMAMDRQTMSAMAFSSKGDVAMFLDERPPAQRLRPRKDAPRSYTSHPVTPAPTPAPMAGTGRRGDSEDDLVGSFIGDQGSRTRRSRPHQHPSLSTTPPTAAPGGSTSSVPGLEETLSRTGPFQLQQTMATGHLPGAMRASHYQFLASVYLEVLVKELPVAQGGGDSLPNRVCDILEKYARAAESISQFRLAQSWRILAYVTRLLLDRRSQHHLERRSGALDHNHNPNCNLDPGIRRRETAVVLDRDKTSPGPRRRPLSSSEAVEVAQHIVRTRSMAANEPESTSGMATPLATPAGEREPTPVQDGHERPSLPLAVHEIARRTRLDSVPFSVLSQESDKSLVSSTDGYDFYDADTLLARTLDAPVGARQGHSAAVQKLAQSPSLQGGREPAMRPSPLSRVDSLRRDDGCPEGGGGGGANASASASSDDVKPPRAGLPGERGRQSRYEAPEELFLMSQTDDTASTRPRSYPDCSQTEPELLPSQMSFVSTTQTPTDNDLTQTNSLETPPQPRPQPRSDPGSQPLIITTVSEPPDQTPHVIESDYLPWPDDPPYPHPLSSPDTSKTCPALDPRTLLQRTLDFECRKSALNASAMILLLRPLYPPDTIDPNRASAILRQHHGRLMHMGFHVEAALLRNLCVRGWPAGMPHWGDSYPAVFGPVQEKTKVAYSCSSCHKPRELDRASRGPDVIWTCERCKAKVGPCAVCGHREPISVGEDDEGALTTWFYCPGCGHGGHASCLEEWHSPRPAGASGSVAYDFTRGMSFDSDSMYESSNGCCPLDGCGHACLPGRYGGDSAVTALANSLGRVAAEKARARGATAAAAAASDSGNGSSGNDGGQNGDTCDSFDVAHGKAVEMAREALQQTGRDNAGSEGSTSALGTSPRESRELGKGPADVVKERERDRDRERRKSVKFAAAAER